MSYDDETGSDESVGWDEITGDVVGSDYPGEVEIVSEIDDEIPSTFDDITDSDEITDGTEEVFGEDDDDALGDDDDLVTEALGAAPAPSASPAEVKAAASLAGRIAAHDSSGACRCPCCGEAICLTLCDAQQIGEVEVVGYVGPRAGGAPTMALQQGATRVCYCPSCGEAICLVAAPLGRDAGLGHDDGIDVLGAGWDEIIGAKGTRLNIKAAAARAVAAGKKMDKAVKKMNTVITKAEKKIAALKAGKTIVKGIEDEVLGAPVGNALALRAQLLTKKVQAAKSRVVKGQAAGQAAKSKAQTALVNRAAQLAKKTMMKGLDDPDEVLGLDDGADQFIEDYPAILGDLIGEVLGTEDEETLPPEPPPTVAVPLEVPVDRLPEDAVIYDGSKKGWPKYCVGSYSIFFGPGKQYQTWGISRQAGIWGFIWGWGDLPLRWILLNGRNTFGGQNWSDYRDEAGWSGRIAALSVAGHGRGGAGGGWGIDHSHYQRMGYKGPIYGPLIGNPDGDFKNLRWAGVDGKWFWYPEEAPDWATAEARREKADIDRKTQETLDEAARIEKEANELEAAAEAKVEAAETKAAEKAEKERLRLQAIDDEKEAREKAKREEADARQKADDERADRQRQADDARAAAVEAQRQADEERRYQAQVLEAEREERKQEAEYQMELLKAEREQAAREPQYVPEPQYEPQYDSEPQYAPEPQQYEPQMVETVFEEESDPASVAYEEDM